MSEPMTLVLLYGGKSGEHEISLRSAASVLAHLDTSKYHIIPIGMDKEGRFFINDYQELLAFPNSLPVMTEHSKPLANLWLDGKMAIAADVVFPVVHGPMYEDGCLQGLLRLADVAYVGCDVLSSAIGMDKDIARRLACDNEIKATDYRVLSWHASATERQAFCQKVVDELGWPMFVKPCSMGSSVGIHKVNTLNELQHAINDARRYDETILVEAFVKGREIELAVLENTSPSAMPRVSAPGEISVNHADGFYSYTAKYLESSQSALQIPAQLTQEITTRLQTMAADIFTRLKCKGMARVDFFVNDQTGDIYFNEINTLPGFTSISMYPKLWHMSGIDYSELLDNLVNLAMIHHRCKQQLVTNYQ